MMNLIYQRRCRDTSDGKGENGTTGLDIFVQFDAANHSNGVVIKNIVIDVRGRWFDSYQQLATVATFLRSCFA